MLEICKVEKQGRTLYVTVRGDNVTEVTTLAARNLAYEERLNHGFENAGIEAYGGSYPVDRAHEFKQLGHDDMAEVSKRAEDIAYEHTFKITRGI